MCTHINKQASSSGHFLSISTMYVSTRDLSLLGERGTKIERGTKVYETHNKCEIISKSK